MLSTTKPVGVVLSIGGESSRFHVGDRVVWPAGVNHGLWLEGIEMETPMVERHGS